MERGLVSCEWLKQEIDSGAAADLRILDATWYLPNSPFAAPEGSAGSTAKDFVAGPRLPGAAFFDIDGVATPSSEGLVHMLPDEETFAAAMAKLGISPASRVVVYDRFGIFSAPRCWYTLKVVFGHAADVAVLDGGLPRWQELGYPLETGAPTAPPAAEAAPGAWRRSPEAAWDLAQVQANIEEKRALLVDARSSGRFHGTAPEPRAGLRGGRVPGSLNLPFTDLLTAPPVRSLRPTADLEAAFRGSGLPLETLLPGEGDASSAGGGVAVVFSCGSGLSSCVLGLALHQLGLPLDRWAVYDGSWSEWGASASSPIVRTGADGKEEVVP